MRLIELDGGLSLRLDLRAHARSSVRPSTAWQVRELTRAELAAPTEAELACSIAVLDQLAPLGWRCYAAFEGGRPVHRSFVDTRPGRPLLLGVETRADARGRGAFRATVAHIGRVLSDEGEPALYSSTTRANRTSVRAHRAAGFIVYDWTFDPIILGVSLRELARRLLLRTRRDALIR